MAFDQSQLRKLLAPVRRKNVKERQLDGKILHYLEGWHVVAEANRIFGFDAWDRETVLSQCVWQKQIDARFAAAYLTRVRITVRAGDGIVVREGLGSGEAIASTTGQAHERASKAAETDATKRALTTFGNPFGLSLYGEKQGRVVHEDDKSNDTSKPPRCDIGAIALSDTGAANGEIKGPAKIDKSELQISEPRRIRNRDHLRFVATHACLICGKAPSQAHHLKFAQPKALSRKVSDEFVVPLCAKHHRELHLRGDERSWWRDKGVEPLSTAGELWLASQQAGVQAS